MDQIQTLVQNPQDQVPGGEDLLIRFINLFYPNMNIQTTKRKLIQVNKILFGTTRINK